MMSTYVGYAGRQDTNAYLGWWGPSGTYRGHNIAMPILSNASYSNAIAEGLKSDDESTGYLYRYDPTSTAGWQSAIAIPSNEVPTHIQLDGGEIWTVSDGDNSQVRYCQVCLGHGSQYNTSPYFASRVALGTVALLGDDTRKFSGWHADIAPSNRRLFMDNAVWLYLDLQSVGSVTTNRGIRFRGQCTVRITTITRPPSVSVGSVITKAQMDSLRNWKINIGGNPTAVTQGDTIKASIGNTYRNTWNPVSASWYNYD